MVVITNPLSVHVYVRKNAGREKTRSKTGVRSRSPKKSPERRPWIPAPAKTSLRDRKGDLKWDAEENGMEVCVAERDGSPKRQRKSKNGKENARNQNLAKTLTGRLPVDRLR